MRFSFWYFVRIFLLCVFFAIIDGTDSIQWDQEVHKIPLQPHLGGKRLLIDLNIAIGIFCEAFI